MIAWLSGVVRVRDPLTGIVVLDVQGVGYQLALSWQTFAKVPEEGKKADLWVHTHVREDVLALYGFASPEERQMFLLLTSVPQVGPKLAVSVLGGFPLSELVDAIAAEDKASLERVPGVGKRTAERILLDLREKVEPLRKKLGRPEAASPPVTAASGDEDMKEEARLVLVNLGWKQKPVDAALDKVLSESSPSSLDAVVRKALAALMSR